MSSRNSMIADAMARSYRMDRLNDALKELLSELILTRIKDPRIGFVTITSVETSPDLMSARVYYSVMGGEQAKVDTLKGLKSARSFLRKHIGRELKLRHVPELRFIYDDSIDKAMAIEEALKKIRDEEEGE